MDATATCSRSATGDCTSMCEFELDDEEAAFAYAEERVRATSSRLAVTNRASQTWEEIKRATQARDIDAAVACYSESLSVRRPAAIERKPDRDYAHGALNAS